MDKPIRIAQIIGKWVGGGVEAVIMNYYRQIDRSKIQFDFLCDEDSTNIPYEEIKKLGGKVILIPPYQKIFKYQKVVKQVLKKGNYKIVHSHINTLSVFPLLAAKRAGVPVRIAHNHATTNKKELKKHIMKTLLKPFSKVFATNYMCCSEHAGRWLFGDKTYDKGLVYLLNNAIDLSKFKYNEKIRKKVRNELNIEKGVLVVGHVGRFVETKNHTFLLDIFKEIHDNLPNSVLLLGGHGPLMNEVEQKISRLNLKGCTQLLGQRDDINEIYQAIDLFIMPSLYEGLGMALIEAECAGAKCLTSTMVPKATKVTENLKFLSLEAGSTAWKNEALKLLDNKPRRDWSKEVSYHGYDIALEVKKLEEYYERVIDHE